MLSLILTVSVLVPGIAGMQIVGILIGGSVLAAAIAVSAASAVSPRTSITPPRDPNRDFWRMPPLEQLPPARLSTLERVWLIVLRAYLVVAGGLVLIRTVTLAVDGPE
jgi:hypothetical protein